MQEAHNALAHGMHQLRISSPPRLPAHSNLYVNNVAPDVDEAALQKLFAPYGVIQSVRLVKNSRTASKSFGFVKFSDVREAAEAISALNQVEVCGQVLEVKLADADAGDRNPELRAPPSDNLYCKNLPTGFTEADLLSLFSTAGDVVECRLLHRGDAGHQIGTGALVRMASMDQAAIAIARLHNTRLPGATAPLAVRYADSPEQKARRQARQQRHGERTSYMTEFSGRSSSQAIPYPHADSGRLSADSSLGLPGSSSGALPSYGGQRGGGGGGGGGYPPTPDMAGTYGHHTGGSSAASSCSIYIKHLPEQADKLYLYEKFAPFGPVLSVKVLLDEVTGLCKGVGFVNYGNSDAATRAVHAMDGMPLGDRRLHVALQLHRMR